MTKIKYKIWQIYKSKKYPDMVFEIINITDDRKDVTYFRWDKYIDWEDYEEVKFTRLSTLIKRLHRNEMFLTEERYEWN